MFRALSRILSDRFRCRPLCGTVLAVVVSLGAGGAACSDSATSQSPSGSRETGTDDADGTGGGADAESPDVRDVSDRPQAGPSAEDTGGECSPGQKVRCGKSVGACEVGVRTCREDGTFGDCEGATTPIAEFCDGLDNDCDGETDEGFDSDGDGVADCMDACPENPNRTEPRTFYRDRDADGYGDPDETREACSRPAGFVEDSTDCDDTDPNVHPGAEECCNGVDQDCDGSLSDGRCRYGCRCNSNGNCTGGRFCRPAC